MLWDSNQVYQAADAKNYEAYIPTEKHTKSFEELQKINPDIIGWIRINETTDSIINLFALGLFAFAVSVPGVTEIIKFSPAFTRI